MTKLVSMEFLRQDKLRYRNECARECAAANIATLARI